MRTKKKNKAEKVVEEKVVEEKVVEEKVVEEKVVEEKVVEEKVVEEKIVEEKVVEEKLEFTGSEKDRTFIDKKEEKEKLTDYEILDSSDLPGEHKKRGRKKGTANSTKETPSDENDLGGFTKEELFMHFIDFVEKANGTITSMITGKDAERYNFNPFIKMLLLAVASKQKKFLVNLKFISETWFFLAALVLTIVATHIMVIVEDRMTDKKEA